MEKLDTKKLNVLLDMLEALEQNRTDDFIKLYQAAQSDPDFDINYHIPHLWDLSRDDQIYLKRKQISHKFGTLPNDNLLHYAIMNKNVAAVKLLLEHPNIDLQVGSHGYDEKTSSRPPLGIAVTLPPPEGAEIIKTLIEAYTQKGISADTPAARDEKYPLDYAASCPHPEYYQLILEAGFNNHQPDLLFNLLDETSWGASLEQTLQKLHIDPNNEKNENGTLLDYAVADCISEIDEGYAPPPLNNIAVLFAMGAKQDMNAPIIKPSDDGDSALLWGHNHEEYGNEVHALVALLVSHKIKDYLNAHPELAHNGRELSQSEIQTLRDAIFASETEEDKALLNTAYFEQCYPIAYNMHRNFDTKAAHLFATMVLHSDEFLKTKNFEQDPSNAERFFGISKRLPLELQMKLSRTTIGSPEEGISGKDSEQAFRDFAKEDAQAEAAKSKTPPPKEQTTNTSDPTTKSDFNFGASSRAPTKPGRGSR